MTPQRTVAEARVSEEDEQVVVEFWAGGPGLPVELSDQLVTQAFSLPLVRPTARSWSACPGTTARSSRARRHVEGAWTRMAGVTCLLEGTRRRETIRALGRLLRLGPAVTTGSIEHVTETTDPAWTHAPTTIHVQVSGDPPPRTSPRTRSARLGEVFGDTPFPVVQEHGVDVPEAAYGEVATVQGFVGHVAGHS